MQLMALEKHRRITTMSLWLVAMPMLKWLLKGKMFQVLVFLMEGKMLKWPMLKWPMKGKMLQVRVFFQPVTRWNRLWNCVWKINA